MPTQGFVGADPEQLDAFADQLDRGARSLEGVRSTIGGTLGRVHWEGRDGEHVRQEWRQRQTAVISAACEMLRQTARTLRTNAAQQRGASESGGGTLQRGSGLQGLQVMPLPYMLDLDDLGDLLDGFQALDWTRGLDLDMTWRTLKHLDNVLPLKVGPLDALSVAVDVAQLREEFLRGDVQPFTVGKLVWDVTSAVVPRVGLLTGAWETGMYIGTGIGNFLQEKTHFQDAIFNSIVADRYGGSLSPAELAEMTERYSGWDGHLRYGADLLVSEAHFIGDSAKSLWDRLF
ncbi:hypothetical protein Cme02nite_54860 [Catellatospora methionotrophica]|uniref:WXG100 family type VII secretion target n=1 Tax=Catellatospora methionotrophica TaxID=121620 RepID=A0A8J3LK83_9ACTN|nr:hypothetical protein [Catellatospora methionotrophica]GIG17154.1 hypothetical protein Cme02nite_54860 [Catellatospora methionotrophica]